MTKFIKKIVLATILLSMAITMTITGNLNIITLFFFIVFFIAYLYYLFSLSRKIDKGETGLISGKIINIRKKGIRFMDRYYFVVFETEDGLTYCLHTNHKHLANSQYIEVSIKNQNSIMPYNGMFFIKDYIYINTGYNIHNNS